MKKLVPVIGLEVHVELSTKSKMFCGCPAEHFGVPANTQTCPTCLGLPGALPYANKTAIEFTVRFGLALGCEINQFAKFDRKHYSYPDLPKGFQTSQYDIPFCENGSWEASDGKKIRIRRIHLEEDTGKLVHTEVNEKKVSLVDYNRSGVPLMEMVTEPDFESPEEVDEFLREVQMIVRSLGISGADMEKGSMRLEANISLCETNLKSETLNSKQIQIKELPKYKVELKNINSFRFLQKALQAEIRRQSEAIEKGEELVQETRGYDEDRDRTFSQRVKEESADYRYFPEPDLPPVILRDKDIKILSDNLPEMPREKTQRFLDEYKLSEDWVRILTNDYKRAEYYEEALRLAQGKLTGDIKISAKQLADVMVNQNKDEEYLEPAGLVKFLVGLMKQDFASGEETKKAVEVTLANNEKAVLDYKNGNGNVIGFLIGQVQRELRGKGDVKLVREILVESLQK